MLGGVFFSFDADGRLMNESVIDESDPTEIQTLLFPLANNGVVRVALLWLGCTSSDGLNIFMQLSYFKGKW